MSIVTTEYFIGDINLPQTGAKYQGESVQNALNVYEPEILKKLLGYTLWKLLDTAWTKSQLDTGDPEYEALPERFNKLINGDEFSFDYNGNTINEYWIGFRNDEKRSILSYYAYFHYRNNTDAKTTTTGEGKTKKENTVNYSSIPKLVYSYNRMVELYGITPKPYYLNKKTIKAVEDHFRDQSNYIHYNGDPSCYNFLLANISDYPEWVFKPVYKINTLGI